MSVIGTPSADGTVQVHCPRPGCSAVLRVKPKAARSWVTCASDGCGHRFVLEVADPPAAGSPIPPPVPARDTFALKDQAAPVPPKAKPDRPRPRRTREAEPARSGKGALIVGGLVVALLLGGGGVFGLVYAIRDKDKEVTGQLPPVAQMTATTPQGPPVPGNVPIAYVAPKNDPAKPSGTTIVIKPDPPGAKGADPEAVAATPATTTRRRPAASRRRRTRRRAPRPRRTSRSPARPSRR